MFDRSALRCGPPEYTNTVDLSLTAEATWNATRTATTFAATSARRDQVPHVRLPIATDATTAAPTTTSPITALPNTFGTGSTSRNGPFAISARPTIARYPRATHQAGRSCGANSRTSRHARVARTRSVAREAAPTGARDRKSVV